MTANPTVGYGTDRGSRGQNQDALQLPPADLDAQTIARKGLLYVVADGMGGVAGGQYASRTAADTVSAYYYSSPELDPRQALWQAIRTANERIFRDGQSMDGMAGMGTTVTAVVIRGTELIVGHVGDSRLYRVRGNQISRVTQDHSWVAEEVRQGRLTQEQADNHERANVLLRAVGTEADVDVDVFSDQLLAGDILMLCSDGLIRVVSDAEILKHLRGLPPQKASVQLIDLANKRGGPDNITVITLRPSVAASSPKEPPVGKRGDKGGGEGQPPGATERPRPSGLHIPWPIMGGVAGLLLVVGILRLARGGDQPPPSSATSGTPPAPHESPGTAASPEPQPTAPVKAAAMAEPTIGPTDTPPADFGLPTATPTPGPTQAGATSTPSATAPPVQKRVALVEPGDKLKLDRTVKFVWQPMIGAVKYDLRACEGERCEPSLGKWVGDQTHTDWCPGKARFAPGAIVNWRVVALDAAEQPIPDSESVVRSFYWLGGCPERTRDKSSSSGEGGTPAATPVLDR